MVLVFSGLTNPVFVVVVDVRELLSETCLPIRNVEVEVLYGFRQVEKRKVWSGGGGGVLLGGDGVDGAGEPAEADDLAGEVIPGGAAAVGDVIGADAVK
jgi:hypothetical protein